VAGFALPGNYVDILVNTQDESERQVSKIVLERILVLAVAQEASRDETRPKVVNAVTLEVTPEQAEKIDLARSIGNLSLVLRNQIDRKDVATVGVRKPDLLSSQSAKPPPVSQETPPKPRPVARAAPKPPAPPSSAPAAAPERVEVIRGVAKSTSEMQ
jgi:pilus assembly protein CpaB